MKTITRLGSAATVALGAMTFAVTAPAAAGDGIDLPDDPDAQVVNLDNNVVVYADGRVFRRADPRRAGARSFVGSTEMMPAPPPTGFELAQLTDDGLAWLFEQADELGMLFDNPDYGDPQVTDQDTTQLTVTTAEGEFFHSVYGLGIDVDDSDAQDRREHYAEFTSILADLDDVLDDEISDFEPWVPDAWVVSPASWLGSAAADWPLDDVPDNLPACVVLPSDPGADTATGAYRMLIDGAELIVIADAALPGDTTCSGASAIGVTHIAVPADPDATVFDVDDGAIVVLADGRVFRSQAIDGELAAGAGFSRLGMPAEAPPPRSPSGYEVATLTEEGLQRLLLLASDAGLFVNEPDYGDGPTDQGYFDVVINAADEIFEHHVYAPGFPTGDPTTQARRDALFGFVDSLWTIEEAFGNDITEFENFVPARWLVTFGGYYVPGPDPWPLSEPPVEGCTKLPSDDDTDTMSGVYHYDGDVEATVVVVAPVIVDAQCDD